MSTTTMGGDRTVAGIGLTGWGMFGAVTLIVLGGLNIVNGFTAIHNSQFFTHQIVYHNLTAWGWVFLIWGILQMVAGVLVFAHSTTGYYLGVCLAGTARGPQHDLGQTVEAVRGEHRAQGRRLGLDLRGTRLAGLERGADIDQLLGRWCPAEGVSWLGWPRLLGQGRVSDQGTDRNHADDGDEGNAM